MGDGRGRRTGSGRISQISLEEWIPVRNLSSLHYAVQREDAVETVKEERAVIDQMAELERAAEMGILVIERECRCIIRQDGLVHIG